MKRTLIVVFVAVLLMGGLAVSQPSPSNLIANVEFVTDCILGAAVTIAWRMENTK